MHRRHAVTSRSRAIAAVREPTCSFSLGNGFIALPGDEFELIRYPARTGEFTTIVSETGFDGLWFEVEYGDESLVLRAAAIPGDANLDAKVTIADLGILAANWQQTDKTWLQADFNGDQTITIADLGILAANWQAGVSAAGGITFDDALAMFDVFHGVAIPEPSAPALIALTMLFASRRRHARA